MLVLMAVSQPGAAFGAFFLTGLAFSSFLGWRSPVPRRRRAESACSIKGRRGMALICGAMTRFSLRLPQPIRDEAQRWADRDGVSLNDWISAAVDRETLRRRLDAHNDWVKDNPLYTMERWQAEQVATADAQRERGAGRGAA